MAIASESKLPPCPPTEGIKYAGSKLKLLPYILDLVSTVKPKSVFDGFSGTTRVAQALAQSGYRVVANDLSAWSKVFGTCYLTNQDSREHYSKLIEHLNGLPGMDGWFSENYGGVPTRKGAVQSDGRKRPWQIHNTRKLDAIREEIDALGLSVAEKAVALTSLMLALDKVDNTLGHYVSYLKKWAQRSFNQLHLEVPQLIANDLEHQILQGDIFDFANRSGCELAYLDPPYGSNNEKMPPSRVRYASYYHIWTTICNNDRPELVGKAMRRADCADRLAASTFEDFRRNEDSGRFVALEAIERLIESIDCPWVVLSYSSGGRATAKELFEVLNSHGKVMQVRKINYRKNVMASMSWTQDWIATEPAPYQEFLFLLQKK